MAETQPRTIIVALSATLADRLLELGGYLERFGFSVATAKDASEVLTASGREPYDAVLFDLPLTAQLGLDTWLEKLRIISPSTVPLAIGTVADLDVLRRSVLRGDGDYTLMPLHLSELKMRLRRAIDGRAVAPRASTSTGDDPSLDRLVGRSEEMQRIRDRIRKVAPLGSTVLITGESGVGKELIARAVHQVSPRRDQPFIALNCSALPESLLESELFGHEKGAFTGAGATVRGKFELAHRGTLFLDEIGDMNPITQAKILRVLEEREFMRVGGARYVRVDVRLVAATNANLPRLMQEGRFREDLYYRLKVLTIEVPPLRARSGDIPELVRAFIDKFTRGNGMPPVRVTDDALSGLTGYRWPGNIRELRHTLENLIVSVPGTVIDLQDLPASMVDEAAPAVDAPGATPGDLPGLPAPVRGEASPSSMEDMERELIVRVLSETGGNRTKAARVLKIGVRTLQRKIKKYGLDDDARAGTD